MPNENEQYKKQELFAEIEVEMRLFSNIPFHT